MNFFFVSELGSLQVVGIKLNLTANVMLQHFILLINRNSAITTEEDLNPK